MNEWRVLKKYEIVGILNRERQLTAALGAIETCGLTPCAPCVCSHHAWMGPVDHEAQCAELRTLLGYQNPSSEYAPKNPTDVGSKS